MADSKPSPASEFSLVIVTPDSLVYEGQATSLIAPGAFQEIAILPDHTPLYSELKQGEIQITTKSGSQENFSVESGIIRVKENQVSIIIGF